MSYLLIGGPLDGERRAVSDTPVIASFTMPLSDVRYALHTLHPAGTNSVCVYVHIDIPLKQRGAIVALRLVEGYCPKPVTAEAIQRRERSLSEQEIRRNSCLPELPGSDLPTEMP